MSETSRLIYILRPDGDLNINHYFSILKQLKQLQYQFQTILIIADIQQLNINPVAKINYSALIEQNIRDCLVCGIDPSQTIICLESKLAELSEIKQLLGAITPLAWLERVQNYKEIVDDVDHTELNSYGLLGVPLAYSSAVLGFNATHVIECSEYVTYIELSREISRRFNHLFGREIGFEQKAYQAINKLGEKKSDLYLKLLNKFQQDGDTTAEEQAKFLLDEMHTLSFGDKNRLLAFLENKSHVYLHEPQIINAGRNIPGTDGRIMSNNDDNTITLHETEATLHGKLRAMPTDPARVRLTDIGKPELCPVWHLHKLYTQPSILDGIYNGCTSATIGCLECKQCVGQNILDYQNNLHSKHQSLSQDHISIKKIISEGCDNARHIVSDVLVSLKKAIQINHY